MDQSLHRVATKEREEVKGDWVGGGEGGGGGASRRWQDDIARKEGTTWNMKATDRGQWEALMEGYILQWMDKA